MRDGLYEPHHRFFHTFCRRGPQDGARLAGFAASAHIKYFVVVQREALTTFSDLLFLISVLFVLICSVRIAVYALQGRTDKARRLARLVGVYIACYAVGLISLAILLPRRVYETGERRCFDDWCVAAFGATVADSSTDLPCARSQGSRIWIAEVEVSSVAKRVRQRARDARAELEDQQGRRYQPCAAPLKLGKDHQRLLSDEIAPGDSFRVLLPFRLPNDAQPKGLVVHHGDFPGVVIIGADQSFLHPPALLGLGVHREH